MARVDPRRHAPRECHGIAHYSQDRGEAEAIGENPDGERPDKLQQHGNGDVIHARCEPYVGSCEHHPCDDTAPTGQEKRRHDAPAGDRAGHCSRNGHAKDQQRARIVEQALTLENHEDAMRGLEATQHGRSR